MLNGLEHLRMGVGVFAQAVLVIAAALGGIHRQVGGMDKFVHGQSVVGEERNPEAGANSVIATL